MVGFIPQAMCPGGVQECTSMCRCFFGCPFAAALENPEILSYLVHWYYIFDN